MGIFAGDISICDCSNLTILPEKKGGDRVISPLWGGFESPPALRLQIRVSLSEEFEDKL